MNQQEIIALKRIVEYLADEKKDYEMSGKPANHIYEDVAVVEKWLSVNPVCSGLKSKKSGRKR